MRVRALKRGQLPHDSDRGGIFVEAGEEFELPEKDMKFVDGKPVLPSWVERVEEPSPQLALPLRRRWPFDIDWY